MSTLLPARSGRARPTLTTFPGADLLEQRLRARPRPLRDLAAPPPGSGLRPVPGDAGAPVLGHTVELLRNGPQYVRERYERYGPVSWMRLLSTDLLLATGPQAAETILLNRDKAYSQSGWEHFIGPFFDRGLMLLDPPEHHEHRRIMQQAFTRPRLEGYLVGVEQLLARRLPEWGREGNLLLYPAMRQLSLDVAAKVFMGVELGDDAGRLTAAFNDLVHGGTAVVRFPLPGGRWAAGLRGRRLMQHWLRSTLPAKRTGSDDDLFAALCEARTDEGEVFTDTDIVNHMIFLMMAAHDTSTTTTCALLYHLARSPEWQERVRAEALALGDGPADLGRLEALRDLHLAMDESLRLVAPVPMLMRRAVADTELVGHYVPAGTRIILYAWLNHLMPDIWRDPQRFDPERFAEPRREDRAARFAYLPFGGGVHKCIGMAFGRMEVAALVTRLLRHYRVEVGEGYQVPWDVSALPFPADGLPVRLVPLRTSS